MTVEKEESASGNSRRTVSDDAFILRAEALEAGTRTMREITSARGEPILSEPTS